MDLIEITDSINRHPWETVRKTIVEDFISGIKKNDIHILDVGSGDAYLGNSFTQMFADSYSYCVDIGYTDDVICRLNNIYDNKRLNLFSSLEEVKVEKVNIVTLLDVIEHVPDDVGFLNSIISHSCVDDDTFFIITVPAYQTLFGRHDKLLKHYRRYKLSTLKTVVKRSDLKIVDGGYFFSSLIILRLLQLVREKILSNKYDSVVHIGTWNGGKFITVLIEAILFLDYRVTRVFKFFGLNLPGLSSYVICQRKKKIQKVENE